MKRTIEERLLNPKPGSKIAAAKEFVIDLTLLIGTLRLTPDQRVRNLQSAMYGVEEILKASKQKKAKDDTARTNT
ncbi:MAG: hypothetical protein ACR2GD_08440 [Pyrinomonadaceae bacterium]